jgi:hypothetical protein
VHLNNGRIQGLLLFPLIPDLGVPGLSGSNFLSVLLPQVLLVLLLLLLDGLQEGEADYWVALALVGGLHLLIDHFDLALQFWVVDACQVVLAAAAVPEALKQVLAATGKRFCFIVQFLNCKDVFPGS